jgi:hypothetical protein
MDKTAPRVRIIEHADVRRMLMHPEGARRGHARARPLHRHIQDKVELGGGHGDDRADAADKLNDLLLPLVKGYCSDKTYELLGIAAGLRRQLATARTTRWSSTSATRRSTRSTRAPPTSKRSTSSSARSRATCGETLRGLLEQVQAPSATSARRRTRPRDGARGPRARAGRSPGHLRRDHGQAPESPHHVGVQGNRILPPPPRLVIGWLLIRQADRQLTALRAAGSTNDSELDFYRGKLAVTRFWVRNVLPGLTLTRKLIEAGTLEVMEIPESAF